MVYLSEYKRFLSSSDYHDPRYHRWKKFEEELDKLETKKTLYMEWCWNCKITRHSNHYIITPTSKFTDRDLTKDELKEYLFVFYENLWIHFKQGLENLRTTHSIFIPWKRNFYVTKDIGAYHIHYEKNNIGTYKSFTTIKNILYYDYRDFIYNIDKKHWGEIENQIDLLQLDEKSFKINLNHEWFMIVASLSPYDSLRFTSGYKYLYQEQVRTNFLENYEQFTKDTKYFMTLEDLKKAVYIAIKQYKTME